jgi:hypothetical protein
MPSVKLILTPYGVLEKRLVMYIDTDYTGIKLTTRRNFYNSKALVLY